MKLSFPGIVLSPYKTRILLYWLLRTYILCFYCTCYISTCWTRRTECCP